MQDILRILGIKEAQPITGGYHSRVWKYGHNGHTCIAKLIQGRGNMTEQELQALQLDMTTYCRQLNQAGVPVSQSNEGKVVKVDDTYGLVLTQPYLGEDLSHAIKNYSSDRACEVISGILDVLESIFSAPRYNGTSHLTIGFDPLPANFTRLHGQYYYIDLMPPRFRRECGEVLVDYPVPPNQQAWELAYWRAYTVEGVLMVLRTQACRLRPNLRPEFCDLINRCAKKNGAAEYFSTLPSSKYRTQSLAERQQILGQLTAVDMYVLRDIACDLAYAEPDRYPLQWLNEAFKASHFKGEPVISPDLKAKLLG